MASLVSSRSIFAARPRPLTGVSAIRSSLDESLVHALAAVYASTVTDPKSMPDTLSRRSFPKAFLIALQVEYSSSSYPARIIRALSTPKVCVGAFAYLLTSSTALSSLAEMISQIFFCLVAWFFAVVMAMVGSTAPSSTSAASSAETSPLASISPASPAGLLPRARFISSLMALAVALASQPEKYSSVESRAAPAASTSFLMSALVSSLKGFPFPVGARVSVHRIAFTSPVFVLMGRAKKAPTLGNSSKYLTLGSYRTFGISTSSASSLSRMSKARALGLGSSASSSSLTTGLVKLSPCSKMYSMSLLVTTKSSETAE